MKEPYYPKDFRYETTGAWARITADELIVYTSTSAPIEYRGRMVQYPLQEIDWVRAIKVPEQQTVITLCVDGKPKSPGLTFTNERVAEDFESALLAAIKRACAHRFGSSLLLVQEVKLKQLSEPQGLMQRPRRAGAASRSYLYRTSGA